MRGFGCRQAQRQEVPQTPGLFFGGYARDVCVQVFFFSGLPVAAQWLFILSLFLSFFSTAFFISLSLFLFFSLGFFSKADEKRIVSRFSAGEEQVLVLYCTYWECSCEVAAPLIHGSSTASTASISSGQSGTYPRGMDGVEKSQPAVLKKKPDQARNALLTCIPSIKARNQARTRRYN